jgi:hypothetical protein
MFTEWRLPVQHENLRHPQHGQQYAGMDKKEVPTDVKLKKLYTILAAQVDGGHLAGAVKSCDKSEYTFPSN